MPQVQPHRLLVVLVPGFSFLALPLVTEPLFIANWVAGRSLFSWRRLSADGLAVTTSSGTQVPVDGPFGPDDEADTVLVLASFEVREAARDGRLLAWLRRLARTRAVIGAVETGSEVLAETGLLDGERAAIHWYNIEGFRERHPAVEATSGLYNLGPRHPTSAGATATLDLMLALIAREAGTNIAAEVAEHLLLDGIRGPDSAQVAAGHPSASPNAVERAQKLMAETLAEPLPGAALAAQVGLSLRQLQRLFRHQLGQSVAQAYRVVRLQRAHQLVQQTDLSLTEISVACGFCSLPSFSRTYRATFGVPPSHDRSQSTSTTVLRRFERT